MITIQQIIIPNWDDVTASVEVWWMSESDWVGVDGTVYGAGNPETNQTYVQRVTGLTVDTGANTLTIPQHQIPNTRNAIRNPSVRLRAYIMGLSGGTVTRLKEFPASPLNGFTIPTTILSATISDPLFLSATWSDLITYATYAPPLPRPTFPSLDDLTRLLIGVTGVPTSRTITPSAPLTGGGTLSGDLVIGIPKATALVDGYLAASDFANLVLRTGNQSIAGNKTLTGTTLLGMGDTINDGAFLNTGAIVNGLKLADSLAASPYAGPNPLFVSDTTRIGDFTAIPWQYRLTKTAGRGDTYGPYSYIRYNVDMTGLNILANSHGLRAVVELSPTNTAGSLAIGYGAWIQAVRDVAGVRAVGAQIEATNISATDAIVDLSGIDSTCALNLSATGTHANGPALYFENGDTQAAAFSTGLMPGPNSISRFIQDNRQATYQISGTWTANGTTTLTGVGGNASREVVVGDMLLFNGAFVQVAAAPSLINTIVTTANVSAASGVITKNIVAVRLKTNSPIQNIRADNATTDTILLYNSSDQLSLRGNGGIVFQSPSGLSTYLAVASGGITATVKYTSNLSAGQTGADFNTHDNYIEGRVIRNTMNPNDKDLFFNFANGEALSKIHLYSASVEAANFGPAAPASGSTAMQLLTNNAGSTALRQVAVAAGDALPGAGFKLLVVPTA